MDGADCEPVAERDGRDEPDADAPSPSEALENVPDWDDEYVDRVSDRLLHNYDLEKDYAVAS